MRKSEREHPASKHGTDKQYLEWLSYQPSCLTGEFNQYIHGVGRNIACHVRRASNAGTGVKPPYSAVPMTDSEHKLQSTHGEFEVASKYLAGYWNPIMAKLWFESQAKIYLQRWIESVTAAQS